MLMTPNHRTATGNRVYLQRPAPPLYRPTGAAAGGWERRGGQLDRKV